jgi:hypothetical protein
VCFTDKDNSAYCPSQSSKMIVMGAGCEEEKDHNFEFFFPPPLAGGARQSGAGFTRSGRMVAACRSIDTKNRRV